MEPPITFLERFANAFNREQDENQFENLRKVSSINNLLHSFGSINKVYALNDLQLRHG